MVKNLYDYLAKPAKTIGEHVEDLLYRANILRKLGYIKEIVEVWEKNVFEVRSIPERIRL